MLLSFDGRLVCLLVLYKYKRGKVAALRAVLLVESSRLLYGMFEDFTFVPLSFVFHVPYLKCLYRQ